MVGNRSQASLGNANINEHDDNTLVITPGAASAHRNCRQTPQLPPYVLLPAATACPRSTSSPEVCPWRPPPWPCPWA
eukprot:8086378-Pyramimonas_sp.AAC.1